MSFLPLCPHCERCAGLFPSGPRAWWFTALCLNLTPQIGSARCLRLKVSMCVCVECIELFMWAFLPAPSLTSGHCPKWLLICLKPLQMKSDFSCFLLYLHSQHHLLFTFPDSVRLCTTSLSLWWTYKPVEKLTDLSFSQRTRETPVYQTKRWFNTARLWFEKVNTGYSVWIS